YSSTCGSWPGRWYSNSSRNNNSSSRNNGGSWKKAKQKSRLQKSGRIPVLSLQRVERILADEPPPHGKVDRNRRIVADLSALAGRAFFERGFASGHMDCVLRRVRCRGYWRLPRANSACYDPAPKPGIVARGKDIIPLTGRTLHDTRVPEFCGTLC